MICKNCNSQINEDDEYCPVCNVFISPYKIETQEVIPRENYILVIENGSKFNLKLDGKDKIIVGRADIGSRPDIDLGPYDKGPYISRKHGAFFWENEILYYEDLGKNGSFINGTKCQKDVKNQIKKGDKIIFGNIKGEICLS